MQMLRPATLNGVAPDRPLTPDRPVFTPDRPNTQGPVTQRPGNMPVYHKGVDKVPNTGPAVLKKGEAVLNTKDAAKYRKVKMAKDKSMKAASTVLGGGKGKPSKEVHKVEVERAANGGHIITHHHTNPEHPPERHTTKGDDEMAQHLMQTMGTPNSGEPEADAGQSGVPDASAGAPTGAPTGAPAGAAPAGPVGV